VLKKLFPPGSKRRRYINENFLEPKVPKHLSRNFRQIDEAGFDELRTSLVRNFFAKSPEGYISSETGEQDVSDHLFARLNEDRKSIVPWLNDVKTLRGANILEIGCGTGSSTVALAEQGAKVVGIDVDEKGLADARERCRLYGLDVSLHNLNATEVKDAFSDRRFDIIIFIASLEHMTHDERMVAMRDTWDMLSSGDLWCVTQTPNRLWYSDFHTSQLPFFNWLPDDLAFKYTRFSPRPYLGDRFAEYNEDSKTSFLRLGRGVSYHEFDLAMKPADQLKIVSALSLYLRRKKLLTDLKWKISDHNRYESLLKKTNPNIHPGFYQPSLDLIIEKD
jgi:S-adenosylmethionine-dependent methyltransferase